MRGQALVLTCIVVSFSSPGKGAWADEVQEEEKGAEWKAETRAGVVIATGNAPATSILAGGSASLKQGSDRFSIEAGLTYVRSEITFGEDQDAAGTTGAGTIEPDEVSTISQTTRNAWLTKGRYDYFFVPDDAVHVAGSIAGDRTAGKERIASAQIGYGHKFASGKEHEALLEAGYDFSWESYVAPVDSVIIHSLRMFGGYTAKLREGRSGAALTAEVLMNVNRLQVPTSDGKNVVGPLQDTRINAKASFTESLWQGFNVTFGVTLRYDRSPAPRPPLGAPYAAGFVPVSSKLDTITELTLGFSFK